jgi:hypothetical protein
MGQTSVPETLVAHQKLTPGYNPKTFMQHDHGGSLRLRMKNLISCQSVTIFRCQNKIASRLHLI